MLPSKGEGDREQELLGGEESERGHPEWLGGRCGGQQPLGQGTEAMRGILYFIVRAVRIRGRVLSRQET